jgi:predicted regulator of Ras-like GTPase activity (Roadblock/LC7/MglB family)
VASKRSAGALLSLDSTLAEFMSAGSGILGVALMDGDGIPIAETTQPEAGALLPEGEMSTLAVEFERVLGEADKAADAVVGGPLRETQIFMARFSLFFTRVADGLTLVVALEPNGNLGKARYLIRRKILDIREEIEVPQQLSAD